MENLIKELSIKLAGASLDCISSVDLDIRRPPHKGMSVRKVEQTVHGLRGINLVHQKLVCSLAPCHQCSM